MTKDMKRKNIKSPKKVESTNKPDSIKSIIKYDSLAVITGIVGIILCSVLVYLIFFTPKKDEVLRNTFWPEDSDVPLPEWKSMIKLEDPGDELRRVHKMKVFTEDNHATLHSDEDTTPLFNPNLYLIPGKSQFNIKKRYPHDPQAFTQGLAFDSEGNLFEATGIYQRSQLRRVDIETGDVLQMIKLPNNQFGEGMCVVGDEIFMLTWHNNIIHVFDKLTLKSKQQLYLPTDGWGLTHDPVANLLIISDGSDTLFFYTLDMKLQRRVRVHMAKTNGRQAVRGYVNDINELEWIDGYIYAHKWHTDNVYVIDPVSGEVVRIIDGSHLWDASFTTPNRPRRNSESAFNGIAVYNDEIYVTGKWWHALFMVEEKTIKPQMYVNRNGQQQKPLSHSEI